MRCIIEVGTSTGDDMVIHTQDTSVDCVFGFEPVISHASYTRQRVALCAKTKFEVINKAVDIDGSPKEFYPANKTIWCNGAGSLLKFNNNNIEKHWKNREDLVAEEPISVECVRLDSFIEEKGITEIVFLEIDAQGKDLDVLKSLGGYIDIVTCGKIEVPTSSEVALYHDLQEGQWI